MRVPLLYVAVLAWSVTSLGSRANGGEVDPRPNFLFIMADDVGVEGFSQYGGTSYATPHIDQLADDGRVYRHTYSQPLCTPSRAQLMTGQYNFRNYDVFGYLDQSHTTIAQVLRDAGYATAIAGKWQLSRPVSTFPFPVPTGSIAPDVSPDVMRDGYGFDEYSLWQLNTSHDSSRYWQPRVEQNGTALTVDPDDYGPDLHAAFLEDFITRHQDQPFFAYYSMTLPHDPWVATPASTEGLRIGNDPALFGDNMSYLDTLVGRVVDRLDVLGIADNTVVVFTSDNGTRHEITSETTSGPVQGAKGSLTDAGTHVPLIVKWPGQVTPGGTSDQLVDFTDFLPTLARLAAAPLPAGVTIDGQPFLDPDGSEVSEGRSVVYSNFRSLGSGSDDDAGTYARDQRYKRYSDGRFFDMLLTPDERPEDSIPPATGTPEAEAAREVLTGVILAMREQIVHEDHDLTVQLPEISGTLRDLNGDEIGDFNERSAVIVGDDAGNLNEYRAVFEFNLRGAETKRKLGAAASVLFTVPVTTVVGSPGPVQLVALLAGENGAAWPNDYHADASEPIAVFDGFSVGDILVADVTEYALADLGEVFTGFRLEAVDPASVPDGPADPEGNSADLVTFGGLVGVGLGVMTDARLIFDTGLVGDLNFDDFVGQADLDIVLANWETWRTIGDVRRGDADGSGYVNQADLTIVLDAWSTGAAPTLASLGLAPVPEPGTALLLPGALTVLVRRRRR